MTATGAIAEINLSALCDNYRFLAGRVSGGCAAVVKANAYGLGAEHIAPALAAAGCSQFFVASIAEGVALRAVLPQAFIGVFYGVASREDVALAIAHNLSPSLNSMDQIARWQTAAKGAGRALPASLHVDTGMSRLGVSLSDARRLAEDSSLLEGMDIGLLMSHLACASTPEHPLNAQQCTRFADIRKAFPHMQASLANSSGVMLGVDYHFDLARPGAALYGINPTPDAENPMRTVVTLKSPVLQIRELDEAETVGYGATYQAPAGSRLATVAGGYADGLIRAMGHQGQGYVNGYKVPVAGIISMDVTVLDISKLPRGAVQAGDMVEFVGENLPVDVVAERANTIGYEVFTAIGSRVQRVYA